MGFLNALLEKATGLRLVRAKDEDSKAAEAARSAEVLAEVERQGRLLDDIGSQVQQNVAAVGRLTQSVDARFDGIRESIQNVEVTTRLSHLVSGCGRKELHERAMLVGSLLAPMRAMGVNKTRVGGDADGGYVMLDDLTSVSHALSFGIGDNDTWDVEVAGRGIVVHQYDHTINAPPSTHLNSLFHQERISSVETDGCETLHGSLKKLNADKGRVILKIDIEGDEWQIFEHAAQATLDHLSQIVCEFHSFGLIVNNRYFPSMKLALEKLNQAFAVVHVHANNSAPWLQLGGVSLPSVLEVTYANRSRYTFEPSQELFPTKLDRPNFAGYPDHYLGNFRWPK
ncbi:MAG: hypothetical protein ACRC9K_24020 [Afipia sp.]